MSCVNSEVNNVVEQSPKLYRMLMNYKFGFIDENGKIVIEPCFEYADPVFSNGVCFAKKGEQCGMINTSGEFVLDFTDKKFFNIPQFINGFSVLKCGEWNNGIINLKGDLIIPMYPSPNDLYVYSYDNGAYYLGKRDMDKQLNTKRTRLNPVSFFLLYVSDLTEDL